MRFSHVLCCMFVFMGEGRFSESAFAQESPAPTVASLKWLAGTWRSVQNGAETEEHWMSPRAGTMLGVNRTIGSKGQVGFEFLRIADVGTEEAKPKVVYYASPGGRPPVEFVMIASSEQHAVFENRENDFPQQIIYNRNNDILTARIQGTVNGKEHSREWQWERISAPTAAEGNSTDSSAPPD